MAFWSALRDPVYCGKLKICSYKDEEETIVQGLHEPIVTEKLFYARFSSSAFILPGRLVREIRYGGQTSDY
jgi:hypothetical protein